MKKTFFATLVISLSLFYFQTIAQTEKGKVFFGGSSNLSFSSTQTKLKLDGNVQKVGESSSFNLSPEVGFFVANKFALGFKFDIESSTEKSESSNNKATQTTTMFGVFLKHYGGVSIVRPIVEVGIGLASTNAKEGNDEFKLGGFGYEIMGGIGVFLNQYASLNFLAGYSAINLSGEDMDNIHIVTGGFNLNCGFNIYL